MSSVIRFFLPVVFTIILTFAAGSAGAAEDDENQVADVNSETMDAAYQALRNQEYDIAYDLFYSLAGQDNALAQYEIGALYHRGAGVKPDVARAARWYASAAELGHAEAQYRLGNMYMMGEGVPQSDTEAIHWYEKAAQQGHKDAGSNLASLQRISTAKTRKELEQEAASLPPLKVKSPSPAGGRTEKRGFFKRLFDRDKKPEPVAETPSQPPLVSQTPASSRTGDKKKGFLGRLFGRDKEKDQQAAEVKLPAGASKQGAGPEANGGADRPAPLANSGAVSNYELGMAYALGNTLEQDYAKAFEHFTRSAEEGYAPAQYRLAAAYANGDGTGKDPARAVEWYEKSAGQGHTAAQRSLALIYLNGLEDVPRNKPLALAWYNLLAEDGNQMDIHRRDTLLQELSEQEISMAQEMAAGIHKRLEAGD
ncbi:MAG: tetratricopeptide repeat protein [Gammaproteobacteria bacterium]|nr:tetratricopeptide repeat protein [Gammaproteobacteria bacterium]